MRVRNAKPREKAFKLYDERGLFLLVTPTGGRLWRRERREAARQLIADDVDPSAQIQFRVSNRSGSRKQRGGRPEARHAVDAMLSHRTRIP
jgi:hypothetical protein